MSSGNGLWVVGCVIVVFVVFVVYNSAQVYDLAYNTTNIDVNGAHPNKNTYNSMMAVSILWGLISLALLCASLYNIFGRQRNTILASSYALFFVLTLILSALNGAGINKAMQKITEIRNEKGWNTAATLDDNDQIEAIAIAKKYVIVADIVQKIFLLSLIIIIWLSYETKVFEPSFFPGINFGIPVMQTATVLPVQTIPVYSQQMPSQYVQQPF